MRFYNRETDTYSKEKQYDSEIELLTIEELSKKYEK